MPPCYKVSISHLRSGISFLQSILFQIIFHSIISTGPNMGWMWSFGPRGLAGLTISMVQSTITLTTKFNHICGSPPQNQRTLLLLMKWAENYMDLSIYKQGPCLFWSCAAFFPTQQLCCWYKAARGVNKTQIPKGPSSTFVAVQCSKKARTGTQVLSRYKLIKNN